MASAAQIAANRKNATRSTGPRTPEGKARAAANAISFGLFTTQDFVAPGEDAAYARFVAAWRAELSPTGPTEEAFAIEITRAAWRLRRCARVESELADHDLAAAPNLANDPTQPAQLDPMLDPETAPIQLAVDRAHLNAHNKLRRSIAELRRIQTEHQFRAGTFPKESAPQIGLTDCRDLAKAFAAQSRAQMSQRRLNELATMEDIIEATLPPRAPAADENWLRSAEKEIEASRQPTAYPREALAQKTAIGPNAPPLTNTRLPNGVTL